MNVVIDGTIYSHQAYGGISRILSATLPLLCDLDPLLRIELLTWRDLKQPIPVHPQIVARAMPRIVVPRFRPERVRGMIERSTRGVNEFSQERVMGRLDGDLWHSLYYWLPDAWRSGERGRTVVTVHDLKEELFPELASTARSEAFKQQKRDAITGADGVICVSEATRADVLSVYGIAPERVWTVPHSADTLFRQNDATVEPIILYVGRRDRFKNFETLLRAFSGWDRRNDFTLIAAGGTDWTTAERALIRETGMTERVSWAGRVDDAALCGFYNRAAAFVYPSLYEGFGIPLLEAMACGCPVIASRIPSSIEVAGDAALYFEAKDADGLLAALDTAVGEGRASALVAAGLERVRAYSWEESARKVLEVYQAVVDA
jgi:glycosyltransferase involved in cell wall biosynthesis